MTDRLESRGGEGERAWRGPARRGLSLVECVISVAIVGVMLTAALDTVGASRMSQYRAGVRLRGAFLAGELMTEVLGKAYEEPTELVLFGRETSELLGPRSAFDDVDDYSAWSESPAVDEAGAALDGLGDWTRKVSVRRVSRTDFTATSLIETGLKEIVVSVSYKGVPAAEVGALRGAGR